MATLADLALTCATQLGRVNAAGDTITDLAAEIKAEIGNAVVHYNRKPWAFTELREVELTTVADQAWYGAVSLVNAAGQQSVTGRSSVNVDDIVGIDYFRDTSDSLDDGLTHIHYSKFERLQDGTPTTGHAIYYTRYAGQIGIYPQPDAVMTFKLSARVKPVKPVNDADTSVWFDQAQEMIEASACGRVCAKYLRDRERAADYGNIAAGIEETLHAEHIRKRATGRLVSHD